MRRRTAVVALALVVAACTPEAVVEEATTRPTTSTTGVATTAGVEAPPGAEGIGDRLYPELGNGGYDVSAYDFSLVVDGPAVEGVAVVEMEVTAPISSLNLDLFGLDVDEVTVDGIATEFEHRGRELIVDLPSDAAPGDRLSLEVTYSGVPSAVPAAAVPFAPGWQVGAGPFYLFSQPDGAQSVFPLNDHPMDRADVEITVTVPAGTEVISGGEVVSESTADGRDTVTWSMEDVAPYLIPLAIGQFELVSDRTIDGVRYDVWASSALTDSRSLETFEAQPEIVAFLEDRFGPYPFDRAGALIVDDDLAAALETQTIPTYTRVSAGWGEIVVAHELAHQWFGDWVTLEQWDDIWLNEGFATFAHWLWIEERQGVGAYDRQVTNAYDNFSGARFARAGAEPADAVSRAADAFPPPDHPRAADLFNASVYERGALTLVALRDRVGDDRMFEFTRTYAERFGGSSTSTGRFLELVEEVLGGEAAELATKWVDDPLPPAMPERGLTPLEQ